MYTTLTSRASAMRAAVVALLPVLAACSDAPTATSAKGANQLEDANAAKMCARCDKPIVFDASPANNSNVSHIYMVSPDGSGLTQLTSGASKNRGPGWSDAYQQIVFVSNRHNSAFDIMQVYTMSTKGVGLKRITYSGQLEHSPAFSPDGKKITFVRYSASGGKIVVINSDGTGELVLPLHGDNLAPSFSPDGQKVIFSSTMHSTTGANEDRELYEMKINGTGLKRLTTDGLYNHNAVFTPDGTKVVFESYRGGFDGIYKMNPDGSNIEMLAAAAPGSGDWLGWATVNAASTKVLFWTDMGGKDELRIVGINGGAMTVVPLPANIEPTSASWSFAR